MIKELLGALGSWSVKLRDGAPAEIVDGLDYFGHVAIVRGPVDVAALGDSILPAARYVGILRERGNDESPTLAGVGMAAWLGDEDEKGNVFETPVVITNKSFADSIAAILPPSVQVGYIGAVSGTYTGTHQFETPRSALNTICSAFGAEWYVRGDGKLYAGTQSQLYNATPNAIVVRRGAGTDIDLTALGGKFGVETDVIDYSTRVVLLGQTDAQGSIVSGSADAPSVPYFDIFGNKVKRTRMISESGTTVGSVESRALLNLNRFNRTRRALKVTAEKYDIDGDFEVGDFAYVYDPDTGIFDPAREVVFRGEVLHPDAVRVSGISYPISEGHTVAFRRGDGTWLDLTPWVVFETGTNEITVGDLPKSLTGGGSNPVQQRANDSTPVVDTIAPAAPSGLTVSTSVVTNDKSGITAQASASWTKPGANEDGTALTDFAYHLFIWKLSTATVWSSTVTDTTTVSVPVLPGRNYDYRVAAVDVNGNVSDYSTQFTALSAADSSAPSVSDPIVSSYLGQLRIYWDGKTATGLNMPADFNRVDVHVGTTSGFTPSSANLISSLVAAGYAMASYPYGSARFVKLMPYDNSGNVGAASTAVQGSTVQVADGDIASMSVGKLTAGSITAEIVNAGRFTTALTGARTEFNASGFYRFDSSNNKMFAADSSGILVVGQYRTALTGRRIEMGAAGTGGRITFLAENNQEGYLGSFTAQSGDIGVEAIQLGTKTSTNPSSPISTVWNAIQIQSDDEIYAFSGNFNIIVGGDGPTTPKQFSVGWADDRGTPPVGTASGAPDRKNRFVVTLNETVTWGDSGAYLAFKNADGNVTRNTGDGAFHRMYPDGSFYLQGPLAANGYINFNMPSNTYTFSMAQGSSRIAFQNIPDGFSAPRIQLVTGNNVGMYVKGYSDSRGSAVEFRNNDDTAFIRSRASAFEVNSDERTKTNVKKATTSFVERVRGTEVKSYRRIVGKDEITPDVEIGLLAQEAPSEIVAGTTDTGMGINLYQMSAMLWGAVRELSDEIALLKKGGKK